MDQTSNLPLLDHDLKSRVHKITAAAWFFPVVLGILFLAAALTVIPLILHPYAPENAPMPASPAMEAQWGVRVSQVATTADNGMVDLRYVILDSEKAASFGVDEKSTPILIPEDNNPAVTQTAQMPHKENLHAGVTYFLLYHNTGGAIKNHTYVTVLLGDLKIEHVPVR